MELIEIFKTQGIDQVKKYISTFKKEYHIDKETSIKNALNIALELKNKDLIEQILIYKKKVEEVMENKHPLNIACYFGFFEVVKFMIENGYNVDQKDKYKRRTPLHNACIKGHLEIVQYLVEKGADIHKKDKDKWDALYFASKKGILDVVKFLLSKGANPNNKYGKRNETCLHIAIRYENFETAIELIKGGAKDFIVHQEDDYASLLNYACSAGKMDLVKVLIEHGADPNIADLFGETALMYAAINSCTDIVELLLSRGANVNAQTKKGETALHWSVIGNCNCDCTTMLLKGGASTNIPTKKGKTVLHYALKYYLKKGLIEKLQLLLKYGAPVNQSDNEGNTPMYYACKNDLIEVIKLLIDHGSNRILNIHDNQKVVEKMFGSKEKEKTEEELKYYWPNITLFKKSSTENCNIIVKTKV